MSLMSMRRKMASKKTATTILWILIVVFLAGVALWSVPNIGKGGTGDQDSRPGSGKAVATVNGKTITAGDFDAEYYKQEESNQSKADVESALYMRKQIFGQLVQKTLQDQAMSDLHVRVGKRQVRKVAEEYVNMRLLQMHKDAEDKANTEKAAAKTEVEKSKLKTPAEHFKQALIDEMKQLGKEEKNPTEDGFRSWLVNDVLMDKAVAYDRFADFARGRLLGQAVIKREFKGPDPFSEAFAKKVSTEEVKARWIFIAAKSPGKAQLAAAYQKAKELRDAIIKDPATFAEKAKESSDFMTSMNGGDLSWIQAEKTNAGLMAEYLAFTQNKGDIGPIVQITQKSQYMPSQVGYGFLQVQDSRPLSTLPKDYSFEKEKELAVLKTRLRYDSGVGDSYLEFLRFRADIVPLTPELKSYQAEDAAQADPAKSKDADKFLEEALSTQADLPPNVKAAISYRVAMLSPDLQKRVRLLEAASPYAGAGVSKLHLEIGRAYETLKQPDKALKAFKAAEISGNESDRKLREQLRDEYKKMKNAEGVTQMEQWLKEHPESAPGGAPGGLSVSPQ